MNPLKSDPTSASTIFPSDSASSSEQEEQQHVGQEPEEHQEASAVFVVDVQSPHKEREIELELKQQEHVESEKPQEGEGGGGEKKQQLPPPVLIVYRDPADAIPKGTTCWICNSVTSPPRIQDQVIEDHEKMFRPCRCGSCHRSCFSNWRQGWITPRTYFSCPNCFHDYKIERIGHNFDPSSLEDAELYRTFRNKVILFWLFIFFLFAGSVALWATITWASDQSQKNIPIAIRSIGSSVVGGKPTAEDIEAWRADFKRKETPTWWLYGIFGFLLSCCTIIILTLIHFVYEHCCEEDDEKSKNYMKARNSSCSDSCYLDSYSCESWCCYCGLLTNSTMCCEVTTCTGICDVCCCQRCGDDAHACCGSGSGGGSDEWSDAGPLIVVIFLVLVIAVVLSHLHHLLSLY